VTQWAAWPADLNRASPIMLRDESLRGEPKTAPAPTYRSSARLHSRALPTCGFLFASLAVVTIGAGCTSCKEKDAAVTSSEDTRSLGRLIWHELMTSDPAAAASFYSDVIGWTTRRDSAEYTTLLNGSVPIGGIPNLPSWKQGERPSWTGTVLVEDVDRTVELARDIGGIVTVEPMDAPSARFAILGDFMGGTMHVSRPTTRVSVRNSSKPGEFDWCEYETTDGFAAFGYYGMLFGWVSLEERDGSPSGKSTIFGRRGFPIGSVREDQGLDNRWLYFIPSGHWPREPA
jgi:predicted enzyme related to lactoylglutathione lyase